MPSTVVVAVAVASPVNRVRRNRETHTHTWALNNIIIRLIGIKSALKAQKQKDIKCCLTSLARTLDTRVIRQIDLFFAPALHRKGGTRQRAILRINKFTHNFRFPFSLRKKKQKDQFTSARHVFTSVRYNDASIGGDRKPNETDFVLQCVSGEHVCPNFHARSEHIIICYYFLATTKTPNRLHRIAINGVDGIYATRLVEGERKTVWHWMNGCQFIIIVYCVRFIYLGIAIDALYAVSCIFIAFPNQSLFVCTRPSACCEYYFHFSIRSIGEYFAWMPKKIGAVSNGKLHHIPSNSMELRKKNTSRYASVAKRTL